MIFTLTNICIPFSGSVEFGYMWNFKAINELWPNLWPQTIAEDGAHIVIWVRWIWWRCQNVTAHFANILSHLKKKCKMQIYMVMLDKKTRRTTTFQFNFYTFTMNPFFFCSYIIFRRKEFLFFWNWIFFFFIFWIFPKDSSYLCQLCAKKVSKKSYRAFVFLTVWEIARRGEFLSNDNSWAEKQCLSDAHHSAGCMV